MSFEKILHFTFKAAGEAIDISRHENHGTRTAAPWLRHGRAANGGALDFTGPTSRVHVPYRPVWESLTGLRVELWLRLKAIGQRRNLIEGHKSFALFVRADGVLTGTFLAPDLPSDPDTPAGADDFTIKPPPDGSTDPFDTIAAAPPQAPGPSFVWTGVNTDAAFAPDGVRRTIPLDTWTKVSFLADGVTSLRLFINDQLAGARYDVRSGVPSVQGAGVHIGQWPHDSRYAFSGAIDEVEVWKLDHHARSRDFLCRRMSARQEACWRRFFIDLVKRLNDPERGPAVWALLRCLQRAERRFVRDLYRHGEHAALQVRRFGNRYQRLWCGGAIAGPEMESFLSEWQEWVRRLDLEAFLDFRERLLRCLRLLPATDLEELARDLPRCDPEFTRYLALIQSTMPRAFGGGPALTSRRSHP